MLQHMLGWAGSGTAMNCQAVLEELFLLPVEDWGKVFNDQNHQKSLCAELPLPSARCFLFMLVWVRVFLHCSFFLINSNVHLKFILTKGEGSNPPVNNRR